MLQLNGIEKIANRIIIGLTVLYLLTEILSAVNCLSRWGVGSSWGIIVAVLAICRIRKQSRFRRQPRHSEEAVVSERHIPCRERLFRMEFREKIILTLFVAVFLILGIMAVLTVPYNWDSMTYHLTRIVHWIQDGNVNYFATNNRRQLISPVLDEYVLLHLMLLTGSDFLVNCLQFFSLVVCTMLAYHMMRKLQISVGVSVCSLLLLAGTPLMLGESLSTQVDLFAAMCLMLAVDKIFTFAQSEKIVWSRESGKEIILAGLAVMLCYLAKPNVCYSLLVLLLWLFVICLIKKAAPKQLSLFILAGAAPVLILPIPVFIRNLQYAGDPFALSYMTGIAVGSFSPRLLLLNAYKNFATIGNFSKNRTLLIQCGNKLASFLQLDLNDPRITYGNGSHLFDQNLIFSYDHDYAGAGVYVLLLVVVEILWLCRYSVQKIRKSSKRKLLEEKYNTMFVFILLLQFFVNLCLIRWQPWVNRLLLPALFLTVIPFAWMMNQLLQKVSAPFQSKKSAVEAVVTFAVAAASVCLAAAPIRYHMQRILPNIKGDESRWELYFAKRPLAETYETLCQLAEGCEQVGIYASGDSYEYPLWVKLKEDSDGTCQIENIVPEEEISGFEPDCIIVLDRECTEYEYHDRSYYAIRTEPENKNYSILMPH